jgi:hypothetical protein
MDRDEAIKRFKADNPSGLSWNRQTLKELIAGRPCAFVGSEEGVHVVIEGEHQVYQVHVCGEQEARRIADKANAEMGLTEDEIDRLIEQSMRK